MSLDYVLHGPGHGAPGTQCRFTMRFKSFALLFALSSFVPTAFAGGFMLTEQSMSGMGRAHAGAGIIGDDASAVWYNPAGMTLLDGGRIEAGGAFGYLDLAYQSAATGQKDNGRKATVPIPFIHATYQLNDSVWLGMSITVPFGMETDYAWNFDGRNRGIAAQVKTFDFNPNIAYKVNDAVSIGLGVSAQYGRASFESGVPGTQDYSGKFTGHDISWGMNVGVMFKPADNVKAGLAWRSKIAHKLSGDFYTKKSQRTVIQQAAKLDFDAPQSVLLTGVWEASPLWTLAASVRWAQWSSFKDLTIRTASGNHSTEQNWKDCWLVSIGADYRLNDAWTLRAGSAYESSTLRADRYRMTTVPDGARVWFSLGATWRVSKRLQGDFGYLYMHALGDVRITASTHSETTIGTYDRVDAHMLGAQFVYRF